MARSPAAFDLVLLDPPFDSSLLVPALEAAARIANPGGFVYLESPKPLDPSLAERLAMIEHRASRAGAVHFALWRRQATLQ